MAAGKGGHWPPTVVTTGWCGVEVIVVVAGVAVEVVVLTTPGADAATAGDGTDWPT